MKQLLALIEKNAKLTNAQLAAMLGSTEAEVAAELARLEREGVIRGYMSLIDWERVDKDLCSARIEIKVTPQSGMGFDEIAQRLSQFEEVETVYLMSGGYDLALTVSGRSFREVALFVSHRLAPLPSVVSTATHFVLRRYKQHGLVIGEDKTDMREVTGL